MRRLPVPPWVLLVSTVLALLAAVATYAVLAPDGDEGTDATLALDPDEAPDAEGVAYTTFDGEEVPLVATHVGQPLVVNFFSKDCVPCIKEMPAFEEVYDEVGEDVPFLGLAVADRGEDALEFVEQTGVTYPTARDPNGDVIHALGGFNLPTTVLLDAEGEVVAVHRGQLTAGELRQLLEDELGASV